MKAEKNFKYFIGIDVSRNELDYAVFEGGTLLLHKERKNEEDDIAQFIKELKELPKFTISKALFVMEYTGIYCNPLLATLKKSKANYAQVNALHVQNSSGVIRGKYDKVDSIRIGRYASRFYEDIRLWVPKRAEMEQLVNLFTLSNRLKNVQGALRKPLTEQAKFVKKGIYEQTYTSCQDTLTGIANDLKKVNKQIEKLIKTDPRFNRLHEIITSVPNVGPVTATQLLISTNEFKKFTDPKKFACYAGVVPFVRESGLDVGKAKVSHIANKRVKTLLHMCAVTSIRSKGSLNEFYVRKTEVEGKHKMSVLNAVRNKLILRIFSCVNDDRLFVEDYKPNF